jgi:outer membrane receptor for ferrienterochelin and colicins
MHCLKLVGSIGKICRLIILAIFLNAENFTDVSQSNVKDVLTDGSPQFTEVWAPLDGYFFNMGLKIKL